MTGVVIPAGELVRRRAERERTLRRYECDNCLRLDCIGTCEGDDIFEPDGLMDASGAPTGSNDI